MKKRTASRLSATVAVVALGSVVVALATVPKQTSTSYDLPYLIEWPSGSGLGSGPTSKAILGEFMLDAEQHSIVLRGGTPVMLYSPHRYTAFAASPLVVDNVVDIAKLPGAGVAGEDAMLFSDATGLWKTDFDVLAGGFTAPTSVAPTSWAKSGSLTVDDVDGNGTLDVVGVASAGFAVLQRRGLLGGGWVDGPTTAFPDPIIDVITGDFDGDGAVEIATLTSTSLDIHDIDGTLVRHWVSPSTGFMTAFARNDGIVGERIAFVSDFPTAGQWMLYTADAFGRTPGISLQIPPDPNSPPEWIEPLSVAAADIDADAAEDLVLTLADRGTTLGLYNTFATLGQFFTNVDYHESALSPNPSAPTPLDTAIPAVGLLTSTTHPGGVFPVDSQDGVFVADELLKTFGYPSPLITDVTYEVADDPDASDGVDDVAIRLVLDVPTSLSGSYDYIQVLVWQMDDPLGAIEDGETPQILPSRASNRLHPIVAGGATDLTLPIYINREVDDWDAAHYFTHVRFVNATITNGVVDSIEAHARTVLNAFTMGPDNQTDWMEYVEGLPTGGPVDPVYAATGGGGTFVGAFVKVSRLPGFSGPPAPDVPDLSNVQVLPLPPPLPSN